MSKQLIFLVETNRSCKSDWMYIKSTLDYYYGVRSDIHYEVIYLDGKTKFHTKDKQIKKLRNQFRIGVSYVFVCIDLDHYQSNSADQNLNDKIERYCNDHCYDLIWFNRNIEHVYLNDENVESKKKKEKSEMFMRKNMIRNVPNEKLNCDKLIPGRSNILAVMDKYFEK